MSILLREGAKELGVFLSPEQLNAFLLYLRELKSWSKNINLTSIKSEKEIIIQHFLDSLSCLLSGKIEDGQTIVDVGTGAGFPGVPIKIVKASTKLVLVDSSRKRTQFLAHLKRSLNLNGVEIVCLRAEDFASEPGRRSSCDIALARAVSSLSALAELALPLLKIGGYLVAQKGERVKVELEAGKAAADVLGGEIEAVKEVRVPFLNAARILVIVKKVSDTPQGFPRRAGIPAKKALGAK